MKAYLKLAVAAVLVTSTTGCGNFLTGGELSNDPNSAQGATAENLFEGIQSNLWAELGSDMSRVPMIWAQHLNGANQQYAANDQYDNSEQTTNGFHVALYVGGGLIDVRKMQVLALAKNDSLFFGIGKVLEAWFMGQGADLFGDMVYSHAFAEANPPLDPQADVYAHVQAVLDSAITFMSATGPTNVGPGPYDLVYGGDADAWIALANTLKARYYLHTSGGPDFTTARAQLAVNAALNGIGTGPGLPDYAAVFSGSSQEQNLWYQFNVPAGRSGYYRGGTFLIDSVLTARTDPRLDGSVTYNGARIEPYFNASRSNLSGARLTPTAPITYASGLENSLLLAEAYYRAGQPGLAKTTLQAVVAIVNPTRSAAISGMTGLPILNEILIEKYIADFQLGSEAYSDYRRTCTPNIPPRTANGKVPGRLFYDSNEQNTNTQIPPAGTAAPNGFFNTEMPARATSEGTGAACRAYS